MEKEAPSHWARMSLLLADARQNEALLYRLKTADTAEVVSTLTSYGITGSDIEACRRDLDLFSAPGAYGKWFYLELPPDFSHQLP